MQKKNSKNQDKVFYLASFLEKNGEWKNAVNEPNYEFLILSKRK